MVTKSVLWMVKVHVFFGGNTAGVEKNTRVRARVVSQAIHELMIDSDKILIMGHQREDYDALGGIIGVAAIARALGKDVRIALSKETSAIDKMVNVLNESEFWKENIITAEAARVWVDANTLTVVCDTHRQEWWRLKRRLKFLNDASLSTITVVQRTL